MCAYTSAQETELGVLVYLRTSPVFAPRLLQDQMHSWLADGSGTSDGVRWRRHEFRGARFRHRYPDTPYVINFRHQVVGEIIGIARRKQT